MADENITSGGGITQSSLEGDSTTDTDDTDSGFVEDTLSQGLTEREAPTFTLPSSLKALAGALAGAKGGSIAEKLFNLILGFLLVYVVGTIITVFRITLDAVVLIGFGGDGEIGISERGEAIGLVDIPFWLANVITSSFAVVGEGFLAPIRSFNQAIAGIAAAGGVAAPTVILVLWITEVGLVLTVLWLVFRSIDIPVVNIGNLIKLVTLPFRLVWRFVN